MKCNTPLSIDLALEYEKTNNYTTYGKIIIGDFHEYFLMSTSAWNIKDYYEQWKYAWDRLEQEKATTFIVNIQKNYSVETWSMYKDNNDLFIQNYLFSGIKYYNFFRPTKIINSEAHFYIPKRKTHTDDGHIISEWHVTII